MSLKIQPSGERWRDKAFLLPVLADTCLHLRVINLVTLLLFNPGDLLNK